MNRPCPNCRDRQLETAAVEGYPLEVDHCPACHGIWLDSGKLEQLLETHEPDMAIPKGAAPDRRLCPVCRKRMVAFQYPRTFVTVDMCKRCHGLWLDQSEFEEIDTVRTFAAATGLTESANTASPPGRSAKEWLLQFIADNVRAHKFW